jgi:hypothetical protein
MMKRIKSGWISLPIILIMICGSTDRSLGADSGFLASLLPGMTDNEESGVFHGAALGAYFGAYSAAWPILAQGVGDGRSGALPWFAAGAGLGLLLGGLAGYAIERQWPSELSAPRRCDHYDLVDPCPGQVQLQILEAW